MTQITLKEAHRIVTELTAIVKSISTVPAASITPSNSTAVADSRAKFKSNLNRKTVLQSALSILRARIQRANEQPVADKSVNDLLTERVGIKALLEDLQQIQTTVDIHLRDVGPWKETTSEDIDSWQQTFATSSAHAYQSRIVVLMTDTELEDMKRTILAHKTKVQKLTDDIAYRNALISVDISEIENVLREEFLIA